MRLWESQEKFNAEWMGHGRERISSLLSLEGASGSMHPWAQYALSKILTN